MQMKQNNYCCRILFGGEIMLRYVLFFKLSRRISQMKCLSGGSECYIWSSLNVTFLSSAV